MLCMLFKYAVTIEIFQNEILSAKRPNIRTDSYFWIHEFRNKDHFNIKVILLTGCHDFISKKPLIFHRSYSSEDVC